MVSSSLSLVIADGYDEEVKMKVSCSHAEPMPIRSDDALLATTSPGRGIESGEKPKPAQANTEANTEAEPAQANAEANPDQARLEALSPCPHAMEQHNFLVLSLMSSKRLADLVEMMRCRQESALRRHFEAWRQAYVRKILDIPNLVDSSEDEGELG